MCAGCYIDWELILDIYFENGELPSVVYCELKKAVEEAFLFGWLEESDFLIHKWWPDDYYPDNYYDEEVIWPEEKIRNLVGWRECGGK